MLACTCKHQEYQRASMEWFYLLVIERGMLKCWKWITMMTGKHKKHWYILPDHGLPVSSEGARECFYCTKALQGSQEGNEGVAYTANLCIAYTTQTTKVHHQHSLVRWDILLPISCKQTISTSLVQTEIMLHIEDIHNKCLYLNIQLKY